MIFTRDRAARTWYVVDLERRGDERGFFARAWCARRVRASTASRPSSSSATSRSTSSAGRFAACTSRASRTPRRSSSAAREGRSTTSPSTCGPTRRRHGGGSASSSPRTIARALYVPEGFAHGYQTLADEPRPSTRCPSATRPRPRAACAGTTRRSRSSGPTPTDALRCSRRRTRAGRTTGRMILVDRALERARA